MNCRKFGLCDYVDCWSCCTKDGTIVDCRSSQVIPQSGTVIIDTDTNIGYLFIELDLFYPVQEGAIINQQTLYVDEDIVKPYAILHEGMYAFDLEIGKNGGYKLDITAIN